jgi:protein tyrosine/serine phosphatase
MSRKILPIKESYWIIPGKFMAGEYPALGSETETKGRIYWLLDMDIDFIIDLTEADERGLWQYSDIIQDEAKKYKRNARYQRMPIKDFSTPPKERIKEILDTVDVVLNSGNHIYLHCQGGKGRTGLIVGCYLVRHGYAGDEALRQLEKFRKEIPGRYEPSPETEGQKRMVLEWKQGQ